MEEKVEQNDKELIDLLPSEIKSSSKAPNDSLMAWGGPRRGEERNKKKTSPRCKNKKLEKAQSTSSSFSFFENENENTTLKHSSGSRSSYLDLRQDIVLNVVAMALI